MVADQENTPEAGVLRAWQTIGQLPCGAGSLHRRGGLRKPLAAW